jgi:hypothetical protein
VLAARVSAVNTCGGFLSLDYAAPHPITLPGDGVRVRLTFGTGVISGGTKLTVNRVRFELDCDSGSPLGLGCTDDGAVIAYEGDGSITSNCITNGDIAVLFSSGHDASAPNQLVFTASPPLEIPASTPDACLLEFDVRVLDHSNDSTPNAVEQVAGYDIAAADAQCDNGLSSSGSQSGSVALCPECDPGACQACNQSTGVCEAVAADADGDGESDGTDRCPDTPAATAVDDAGCSQEQFCANISIPSPLLVLPAVVAGAKSCKKADWRNDEPIMKRAEADCEVDKGGRGPEDDRCVAVGP